jgi:uncharacterized tellurite resistance protein B-like protein
LEHLIDNVKGAERTQEDNMPKPKVIKSLAKVIIAAAWADGNISHEELNSLKDLLFLMPEMTASDWAELDIYIEEPVGEEERARLIEELRAYLVRPSYRKLAQQALETVIQADGMVSEGELQVLNEIREELLNAGAGVIGQIGRLVRAPIQRRSRTLAEAPNREENLVDFMRNKVYYSLNRLMQQEGRHIDLPEAEIRKLSLAGGLMARVANVDGEIQPQEMSRMSEAMQAKWHIAPEEADLVAEVAALEISRGVDTYRLTRHFFESTSEQERLDFLDVLFAVADGDGFVSYKEIEEIRTIATVLKLRHKQFIAAKLRIPRERRAST